jgi:hypothetical protein
LKTGKLSASKNVTTALDAGFNQIGETLQRFTDIIKKSLLPQETPAATQHDKGVELVQEHNDGLTFDERIALITYLTDNPTAVCTYLALKDDKYREGWVQLIVRRFVRGHPSIPLLPLSPTMSICIPHGPYTYPTTSIPLRPPCDDRRSSSTSR